MMFRLAQALCITILYLTLSATGYTQEPQPIPADTTPAAAVSASNLPDYSGGIANRDEVLKSAHEVTAEKYPDADEVLLSEETRIRYEEDGCYTQWQEDFIKILNEKSRRSYQTLSSYFSLPYQNEEDCKIPLVEVIRPDGTVVKVDVEKQSRVMVDRSQMGANIYNPNDRIRQVALSEVNVGDVIHFVMYDRTVVPRMKGNFSDMNMFEDTRPILHAAVVINSPKGNPLRSIALKNEVPGTVTYNKEEKGDRIIHSWTASNIAQIFPEPDMPPAYTQVQRLLVSTAADWQTVSKWYWKLCLPHLDAVKDEMKAKVAELTKGVTDRRKQIEAIFQFVSQDIRYMGITTEDTAPGYEPHNVCDTFSQKHGVCRDKAALLVAMLRLGGMDAYPVLIHTSAKKDTEVPQPYFNHAISAVKEPDGSFLLMDSTDESTKQLLPGYLDDCSYLVATPEGEPLRTSATVPATENMMNIQTSGSVDSAGTLLAESTLVFNGINDNVYRGYFARIKPDERKRFFEGILKNAIPGAKLTEYALLPENMQDMSQTLTLKMQYKADNLPVTGKDVAMLPLPALGMRIGLGGRGLGWVNYLLDKAHLQKRRFPFRIDTACGVKESISLKLDDSLKQAMAMPSAATVDNDKFVWKKSMGLVGGLLQCDIDFSLKKVEYTTDEYLEMKKLLQTVEIDQKKMPLLAYSAKPEKEPEQTNADATVLSEKVQYELKSATEWTETRALKRQILTYAGKKRFAELKVNYNPVWETVKLEDVKVTSPDGKVATISEKEINLMDAAWVGSAPRYPAAKTFVASFPAVDVGSIIDYTLVRECKDRPFFACQETFQYTEPLMGKEVVIIAPDNIPLKPTRTGPDVLESYRTEEDGVVKLRWVARLQPAIEAEDFLPPWWSIAPTISVSSGNYSQYSEQLYKAFIQATEEQAKTAEKAKELIAPILQNAQESRDKAIKENQEMEKGLQPLREEIRKGIYGTLRDYVVKNIRLSGPSLTDAPLSVITPADVTLTEGYGNATDRAIILYTMLRAAGYNPDFALPTVAPRVQELQELVNASPNPDWFGDLLIKLPLNNQSFPQTEAIYLGDTNEYDKLGVTRSEGRLVLNVSSGIPNQQPDLHGQETNKLTPITVKPRFENKINRYVTVNLNKDGSAEVYGKLEVYGASYGVYHRQYAEMTPEERSRELQRLVTGISQGAEPISKLEDDFRGYPGIITYKAKVDRLAVRDGNFLYMELPESLSGALTLRSETRKRPLYWSAPLQERLVCAVVLPDGMDTPSILPKRHSWQLPSGTGSISLNAFLLPHPDSRYLPLRSLPGNPLEKQGSAKVLIYDNQIDRQAGVIPTGLYSDLLQTGREIAHPSARVILLHAAQPVATPSEAAQTKTATTQETEKKNETAEKP